MGSIEFEDDIVSVEEVVELEAQNVAESPLTRAARAVFYALCFLFPLWFLPVTIEPVEFNKISFFAIATLIIALFTLGGLLQEGRIRKVGSRAFSVVLFMLAAWLLSSLFSESVTRSLWGFGGESTSFTRMLALALLFFAIPIFTRGERHIRFSLGFIFASLFLGLLFFFIQSVFSVDIFRWDFAAVRSFHPFGSWNALALLFGFGAAAALPFFSEDGKSRWAYYALFTLSLLGLLLTNFAIAWGILAAVTLLFVALTLSRREQRSVLFAASLATLLASILLVLLNVPLSAYFQSSFDGFGRPQEVVPSYANTLEAAKLSLSSSPLLGTGPNTFGFLWERVKPPSINNTIFWQTRFTSGFNTVLTLLAEVGIVGALAFLVFAGIFVWHGVRAIGFVGDSDSTAIRATFASGMFLLVAMFLYPFNFTLFALFFIAAGLFFAALGEHGVLAVRCVSFFETKERGFLFSLTLIFLLVGGVVWSYFETTRYLALAAYSAGVEIFNKDASANAAIKDINRAIALDPYQDRYQRAYAELEHVKMSRAISQGTGISQEERIERFRTSYTEAKARAEAAVELEAKEPQNHRMLGRVYELAIPFDESLAERAIEHYERARELSPVDPVLFMDIARTYLAWSDVTILRGGGTTSRAIAAEKQDKAIEHLTRALELKPDLTQARFTLSQLYFARNQIDEAVTQAEAAVVLAPDNIGTLFQLGFLYYQRGSYERSRQVFERAVGLSPNYSNARYFLGLIYDRAGRAADALEEFTAIQKLNPDNAEIARIVDALKAGKKAADAIGEPPPERRKDAPLKEF